VGKLVSMINRKLQIRDSSDAKANIAFLKMQIEQTSLASMHSVFYSLVEEQTKTLMLANASDEYVFKMVSEPRAPEEKSKPLRAVICVIGMFLGIVLGSFVVVIMFVRKRDKA
jgi:LPS O-antigen subunit length determinant protein (WzzB/FepE family)